MGVNQCYSLYTCTGLRVQHIVCLFLSSLLVNFGRKLKVHTLSSIYMYRKIENHMFTQLYTVYSTFGIKTILC